MTAQKYDLDEFAKLIYGGSKPPSTEETVIDDIYDNDSNNKDNNKPQMPIYKPRITRPTMSKFEFVRICTAVAKLLYSLPDLSKYINTTEVNNLINPSEVAFLLVINGKINAIFDRLGYEKVTMSELRINPIWIETCKNYFNHRHQTEQHEILEQYGLLKAIDDGINE